MNLPWTAASIWEMTVRLIGSGRNRDDCLSDPPVRKTRVSPGRSDDRTERKHAATDLSCLSGTATANTKVESADLVLLNQDGLSTDDELSALLLDRDEEVPTVRETSRSIGVASELSVFIRWELTGTSNALPELISRPITTAEVSILFSSRLSTFDFVVASIALASSTLPLSRGRGPTCL